MDWKKLAETIALTALKQDIVKFLLSQGLTSWLGGGILGFFAGKIAMMILKQTELGISYLANYVKTAIEDHEFKAAAEANAAAQQGGSDEDKKKSEQALIDHARSFIKLNNFVRIQPS